MAAKITKEDLERLRTLESNMSSAINAWDETMDVFTDRAIDLNVAKEWLKYLSSIRADMEGERNEAAEECPEHYRGDGFITCEDAMESMLEGVQVRGIVARWWADALKYVWRWPLKQHPTDDLAKAKSCIDRLESFVSRNDYLMR